MCTYDNCSYTYMSVIHIFQLKIGYVNYYNISIINYKQYYKISLDKYYTF